MLPTSNTIPHAPYFVKALFVPCITTRTARRSYGLRPVAAAATETPQPPEVIRQRKAHPRRKRSGPRATSVNADGPPE